LMISNAGDHPFDVAANLRYNFIFVVISTHHSTFDVLYGKK